MDHSNGAPRHDGMGGPKRQKQGRKEGAERVTGCNNNIKKKGGGPAPPDDEREGGILWMDGTKDGKTERKRRIEWLKCEKLPFGCRLCSVGEN